MNNLNIEKLSIPTPAFVYDESIINNALNIVNKIKKVSGCKVLYSVKALSFKEILELISGKIDGFSASSVFESKLGREVIGSNGIIHFVSPGIKIEDFKLINQECNYITLNSLSQLKRFKKYFSDNVKIGLRINPQITFIRDERYNPVRKNSKLGVPLDLFVKTLKEEPDLFKSISGIHFHTNCESDTLMPLLQISTHLERKLKGLFSHLEWINFGGGYQYDEINDFAPLYESISIFRKKYNLNVFIEPGEAIVGNSGYIVSRVIDIFESGNKMIAILDTSVNHMPQVFEYQYQPEILNSSKDSNYRYILAGCSCLAGDIFGKYCFQEPLKIGSKIVFCSIGAYSIVKAHMFNGIDLPTIYSINYNSELVKIKEYNYNDFLTKWGENIYAGY